MNRSSPAPVEPERGDLAVRGHAAEAAGVSTLVVPPISAFFSITDCTTSSVGPTCATVTGPVGVTAKLIWRSGPLALGVEDQGLADDRRGVTVRRPSLNVTSKLHLEGHRPAVRGTDAMLPLPIAATVVIGSAAEAGDRHEGRRVLGLERDELECAPRGHRIGELPVLVHARRLARGRRGAAPLAPTGDAAGRLEEGVDLGRDDERGWPGWRR